MMKKTALALLVLIIAAFIGCNQHKSPAAITGTGYYDELPPKPGTLNHKEISAHLCKILQPTGGLIKINSQAEYDAYINSNNVYSGLTFTPEPIPVDYAHKTLIGYILPFTGGPQDFNYTDVLTDGTTVTLNALWTEHFCPGGPFMMETCLTFFTITDKTTKPLVLKIENRTVDCAGNTIPKFIAPMICTPVPVAYEPLKDAGGLPAAGYFSNTGENITVNTQAEYDAFLAAHYIYTQSDPLFKPVQIDFSQKTLIAVFMGQEPNTCFSIDIESINQGCSICYPITSIVDENGIAHPVGPVIYQYLDVKIKETVPGPADVCGQVMTNPCRLVLIDKVPSVPAGSTSTPAAVNFKY